MKTLTQQIKQLNLKQIAASTVAVLAAAFSMGCNNGGGGPAAAGYGANVTNCPVCASLGLAGGSYITSGVGDIYSQSMGTVVAELDLDFYGTAGVAPQIGPNGTPYYIGEMLAQGIFIVQTYSCSAMPPGVYSLTTTQPGSSDGLSFGPITMLAQGQTNGIQTTLQFAAAFTPTNGQAVGLEGQVFPYRIAGALTVPGCGGPTPFQ